MWLSNGVFGCSLHFIFIFISIMVGVVNLCVYVDMSHHFSDLSSYTLTMKNHCHIFFFNLSFSTSSPWVCMKEVKMSGNHVIFSFSLLDLSKPVFKFHAFGSVPGFKSCLVFFLNLAPGQTWTGNSFWKKINRDRCNFCFHLSLRVMPCSDWLSQSPVTQQTVIQLDIIK